MESLNHFIAASTVLSSAILQGLAIQVAALALWRIFGITQTNLRTPIMVAPRLRIYRLTTFFAMLCAFALREAPVILWGPIGPWPPLAVALSGSGRWLLIATVLAYAAGETYQTCRHRCWLGFLGVALVYGVAVTT